MTELEQMTQTAPYPRELAALVERCEYRPGWRLTLTDTLRDGDAHDGEAGGLTLIVTTLGYDTYHPERGEQYRVNHYFPVPAATYNRRSWQWWLFQQLLKVEQHEAMEFFTIKSACTCGWSEKVRDGKAWDGDEPHEHAADCDARDDPDRPYAPMHGPGNDPYLITVERSEIDRRTNFRGEVES